MGDESALPRGAHCRICGSATLNVSHYALDSPNKVGIHQALVNDSSLDRLIRPCDCRGDFAYAHRVCLSEWIETTKHEFCDICRFKYYVRFYDATIFDWMSELQQVSKILKMLCLSTLVYYISALGILNHFLSRRTPTNVFSIMVFTSSCIWAIFCTLGLVGFAIQSLIEFQSWRLANRRVFVDENNNPQLETSSSPKDILKSSGFKPR